MVNTFLSEGDFSFR